jgi:hypothetical protein
MTSPGVSYEEYQQEVRTQEARDRDRFTGRDEHATEALYSAEDGKLIRGVRPRLVVELDDAGLPVIVEFAFNNGHEARELGLAANDEATRQAYGVLHLLAPRDMALRRRENEAQAKAARAAYQREFPCACQCSSRFKTERGLAMHRARTRWAKCREQEEGPS